ncbi:MAG: lipoprotein insertase outer membrane protein LolB [Methylobacter sp.]|nr:lipoprotein insertase outer membrane protein LolB [Methylobacter sp.]MDP2100670.1 lipoprotein insertase outer membrane protein LolB [Methylobacter sp.]MDP2428097.1 lipoprotein insertase outer membrane protein LolB [Methylobacter sp.]MDP3054435.1 lipoprotein insertase outer membrane protein LolB [Methylobacter sp.]MDP3362543.1 lipoprotein insertase outer membrane protein LolB [Methylobacter sp.]
MAKSKALRVASGLWVGCLLSLLSACSVAPVEPGMRYSRAAMNHLYDVERWSFDGRLALTGQTDSWSANISWQHAPELETIKLSGPLGQGAVVISLAGNVVTIDRGGDDVQTSTQPEEFINQQLGMFVPVRSLRYWVVGLPEPSNTYKDADAGFNQDGWLNEYKQMQMVNDGVMPHKMTVMNDQVKLKLIIDRWVLQ